MKYRDITYPTVLVALTSLMEVIEAELLKNENEELEDLLFELDGHIDQIKKIISNELDDSYPNEILSFIYNHDVERVLTPINLIGIRKLRVLLSITSMLEGDQNLDMDNEVDLPVERFTVVTDEGPEVPFNVFGFFNSKQKLDSIGYFNFRGDWQVEVPSSNFNNSLLACSLKVLGHNGDLTFDEPYIIVRDDATNKASVQATLRLQAVAHGIPIHSAVESGVTPSCIAPLKISALQPYQQFNESILILSEFHSRKEILNKFLSLYHVIESFMYKIPIAELGSNNGGKMFSIRDFKRLYASVDKSEINAIKDICKGFWSLKINNNSFESIVKGKLKSMSGLPGFDKAEFNRLLSKLEVAELNGFNQLQNCQPTLYATLIYKVRCAIVHNSETEFHISHFNLSQTMIYILDELLMEPLEMLVLDQIAEPSSRVWYKGPSLQLYEV